MTDEEHREIALAIAEGKAYHSGNVPQNLWFLVFMPLTFMASEVKTFENVAAVVAIVGKHKTVGARGVNGFPIFTECQLIVKKDWKAIATYVNQFIATRKAMLKKSDKPKLPRAPLPKQTGGAHKTRKKELHRKMKHKKPVVDE